MINFDYITKEKNGLNSNLPQIPDHPYKIFIISGSESRKTNTLFNLISHQPDIGKIYLYAKDRHEGKYQLLINKLECAG